MACSFHRVAAVSTGIILNDLPIYLTEMGAAHKPGALFRRALPGGGGLGRIEGGERPDAPLASGMVSCYNCGHIPHHT